ncbi:MAG: S8 family serine peptidase [Anaerolineae bacterium]
MTRVIAHFMHEQERDAAQRMMTDAEVAEGYLVGEVDEARIPDMEAAGLIVETLDEKAPLETPGRDWEVMPGVERPGEPIGGRELEAEGLEPLIDPSGPNFYLLQLKGPLMEGWRQQIDDLGIELLEYIPHNAYTARLALDEVLAAGALPFVSRVRLYTATDTGLPLASGRDLAPDTGEELIVTYDARLHRAEDMPAVLQWLADEGVEVVGSSRRKVRLRLPQDDLLLDDLAALPEVASIEEYVPPELHNNVARVLLGIDLPPADDGGDANPGANLPQTGEGQIVAVADTGLDQEHPDFADSIVGVVALGRPDNPSDPHGHGTHVAGSVLGRGTASGGLVRGTAPRARLFFQSLLDDDGGLGGLPLDLSDLFEEAYQAGARIHNNSWGAATESAYTFNSIEVDEFVAQRRDMLVIISAGNEGQARNRFHTQPGFVDWLSIGSPASAKNVLTVGASRSSRTEGGLAVLTYGQAFSKFPEPPIADEKVSGDPEGLAAFSSRGPCDDRRIKPDVVAPGTDIVSTRSAVAPLRHFWGAYRDSDLYAYMGGTSMSAPLVAGCAALIRQYYVEERDHQPSAALLKATIINSTRRLTGADALAEHELLPNFHQGFGCVYMPWAIPNPAEPGLGLEFVDGWQEGEENDKLKFTRNGQRLQFRFSAGAGRPLRLCLVWTDLPARSLQNNLNIFLQLPDRKKTVGNPDLPQKLTATDRDNNVEIIRLEEPPAGDYLVQITASNLLRGPQDFGLVVTGDLNGPLQRQ